MTTAYRTQARLLVCLLLAIGAAAADPRPVAATPAAAPKYLVKEEYDRRSEAAKAIEDELDLHLDPFTTTVEDMQRAAAAERVRRW